MSLYCIKVITDTLHSQINLCWSFLFLFSFSNRTVVKNDSLYDRFQHVPEPIKRRGAKVGHYFDPTSSTLIAHIVSVYIPQMREKQEK